LRIRNVVFELQVLRTAILVQNYCLHRISPMLTIEV
jgi:hypothetical protein